MMKMEILLAVLELQYGIDKVLLSSAGLDVLYRYYICAGSIS